eukprot:gene13200-1318_t
MAEYDMAAAGDLANAASYEFLEPDEEIPDDENVSDYISAVAHPGEEEEGAYDGLEPDWLEAQWDKLKTQPWFAGDMNRVGAIEQLKDQDNGHFVSSKEGHFALSVVTNRRGSKDGLEHLLIMPSFAGKDSNAPGNTRYRLGTGNHCLFNTIAKLIAYYIGHDLSVDGFTAKLDGYGSNQSSPAKSPTRSSPAKLVDATK